ncbi:MAG: hypothetical protein ONB16_13120 [candidate division KSB1 bacterium]|nr:hypothetical protein [candidate division KSB1 bacterium]MDZ7318633.1 hypothetical protein [candidate division KSB1 bacterium]MDZ7340711.1 hypothetical protein [candidate division KSB1 bacterium]
MKENLSPTELTNLIRSVFSPRAGDKNLAILLDVPDQVVPDNADWRNRRELAQDWHRTLSAAKHELALDRVDLIFYPNVHSNNADLPEVAFFYHGNAAIVDASLLSSQGQPFAFELQLARYQMLLAPTEFSTTAPLKLLAKKYQFRAATMPGFSAAMIPALRLDYEEITRRVDSIKKYLDAAVGMTIDFVTSIGDQYQIYFDLRFRTAHASGGRFPEPGVAGNLPSGEAYIVPYEGERGEPSQSHGILPVQFGEEIVLYQIEENVARKILSQGEKSSEEAQKIKEEPAYANIAEIGFGVLADFGVKPIGEILLDEKLGLHIAFGRSDHFGGAVGVKDFSSTEKVIHIDRIYIPETQPQIVPEKVQLQFEGDAQLLLMAHDDYQIWV